MSVRGRIGDFEREDQEAILSLLVNSPSFNGFGKLKAALNSPGAEIELYLSSEIRDQQGKTLTANQPEPNQIPKNSEDSKATPIPSAESRQIVMQSFPRMYDLDLIANTDVGMRLMEQMRRAKRKSFEEKISDLGIDSFKKQWLNPKGWDGKSSTTFSELDPASQDLIRKGLGHERTFTGTEKISPIRTNLIVSIAWQDGEFRRFSGASVMTALK
ncbi:hypothetical protein EON81_12470 [bacterium]|nr:MAG: hypothetical protein EON81_12470 [bacterium]